MADRCEVLDWAASGAMALTGMPDGAPAASPAPALAMLAQVSAEFARATVKTGKAVRVEPAELVAGRAALAGFTRGGRVSAGRSSFLLRAADGWCAVTLSRPDDVAVLGSRGCAGLKFIGQRHKVGMANRSYLARADLGAYPVEP